MLPTEYAYSASFTRRRHIRRDALTVTTRWGVSRHITQLTTTLLVHNSYYLYCVQSTCCRRYSVLNVVLWQRFYDAIAIHFVKSLYYENSPSLSPGWLGGSVVSIAARDTWGQGFDAHSPWAPVAQWGVTVWTANNCDTRQVAVLSNRSLPNQKIALSIR